MATKDISDRQVMVAYALYHLIEGDRNRWPYEILQEWTGQPEIVCWSAMQRADKRRLIDVGVSLRTAWPTEKGLALLDEPMSIALKRRLHRPFRVSTALSK